MAEQKFEERAFAAPIGAENGDDLARLKREGHVAERGRGMVRKMKLLNGQQWSSMSGRGLHRRVLYGEMA